MLNIVSPIPEIGMGYSTYKHAATAMFCVNISLIKSQIVSTAKLNTFVSMDFVDLQKEFAISLNADMQTQGSSFGLSVDYADAIKQTDYSLSYSFMYNVKFSTNILHVQKYGINALNEFGKTVLNEDMKSFYLVCGDQFIIQEKQGAQLSVTLSIRFTNKKDKENFEGKVEVGFEEFFDASLEHISDSNNSLSTATIGISALQVGGDAIRLSKILGNKISDSPILDCNLENNVSIANCKNILNQVINYAETDFIKQFNYTALTNIDYVYINYETIGINVKVEAEFEYIKDYLLKLYSKINNIKTTLDNVALYGKTKGTINQNIPNTPWSAIWTWNPKLLSVEILNQINYARIIVKHLGSILKSKELGIPMCYDEVHKCKYVLDNVQTLVENYDKNRQYKFASQIADVSMKLENTEPFKFISKVYIANIDCGYSFNYSNVDEYVDKYTGRILMPIGKHRYYEDSKFEHINDNIKIVKNFHNLYELIFNEEKTVIKSLKIAAITDKITKYDECGELYINHLSSIDQHFEGYVENTPELNQCVKLLCMFDDNELTQVKSIQISLYEYNSPL